jgi:hypothetical protein
MSQSKFQPPNPSIIASYAFRDFGVLLQQIQGRREGVKSVTVSRGPGLKGPAEGGYNA